MNSVVLIGRLTRDPEIRYTSGSQMAVCRFTVAIDRMKKEDGTDFIPVVTFGKTAELCEKYLHKGIKTAVEGRIQTGSYENKEGKKVYTTDVIANRIEFIEWGDASEQKPNREREQRSGGQQGSAKPQVETFDVVDDDVPF